MVVEYTELTEEQKRDTLPEGGLKFRFGSVAIHTFSLGFLCKEADSCLPLHIAHKKVPYCDPAGNTVQPEEPNAYKFEKFIFDVLPDAERSLNLEFRREDEFSPVKNASGADSPVTARRDMMRKHARWLEACGVTVPRDSSGDPRVGIEIDPRFALSAQELAERLPRDFKVGDEVLLAPGG
jgi:UDP-N-acetylglucosamine/UDP-N-acetylgalactosamine diphosphorylase